MKHFHNFSTIISTLIAHIANRYGPSQGDVASFKGLKEQPDPAKYPHAYRWYKHISTYQSEFPSLPGDPSKAYTTYGPEKDDLSINPKDAPSSAAADGNEEDEDDLFGSDEEDAEAARIREENLAAYKKKKEGKTKPAAKSLVTLDVKPWGKLNALWTSLTTFPLSPSCPTTEFKPILPPFVVFSSF